MSKVYCIFAAQYLPHLGGVERYTYHLSKELIRKGDNVIIVTSNVQNLPSYERVDGIPVYRFPCFKVLAGRYPVIKPNKEFFKIHKKLKNTRFDMIIINTRFYFHSLYAAMLAKAKQVRTITIDHGSSHLTVHNPFWDLVGSWFEHGLTAVLKRFCHEYYGVSEASNQWLKHFHIESNGTLNNAIDLNYINDCLSNTKVDFREKYNISKDALIITYTGRLLKEKGLLSLTQAVRRLNEEYKNVYLILAGDGDLEEDLRHQSTANIILTGRLAFPEIIDLLKTSDIFCLPSVSEGFSTSILEAVACKNYIIVSQGGCPKELIQGSSYGTILPSTEPAAIYNALVSAIKSPELRKDAITKTYDLLVSNFTWDITSDKVRNL